MAFFRSTYGLPELNAEACNLMTLGRYPFLFRAIALHTAKAQLFCQPTASTLWENCEKRARTGLCRLRGITLAAYFNKLRKTASCGDQPVRCR